ncbi:MAG: YceI family protein [Bdellovibrionales bacterium]|nr:YceI family protein [Bdellovibrionales bacterium]
MKQARLRVLNSLVILCALSGAANSFAAVKYVKGKYEIDPAHTRVSFTIPHFVISQVEGRFDDVKGDFTIAEPFAASKANVVIDVKSVDTGVQQRDDDLRSKNFFEVAKYPTMKFVTKSVTGTPESFKVVGALTIKDVTKDVTLDGKLGGSLKDPWGNERSALTMTGMVNRRDFHINYNEMSELGPGVGDEVTIRISVDGIIPKKK